MSRALLLQLFNTHPRLCSDPGNLTVFAPTNAAFSALPPSVLDWLLNARTINIVALSNVLKFHVLNASVYSSNIAPTGTPLSGLILCSNCTPALTAFNDAGSVTVKASAVGPVLTSVAVPNVTCSNGVVHVVGSVLVPGNQGLPTQNVVQVATAAGLSLLVSALTAAGLASTFTSNNVSYTVFAPTNAAFAAVPAYISSNVSLLTQVLTYHVKAGRTYAQNLQPLNTNLTVPTLNGQSLKVLSSGSGVSIFANGGNVAKVVTADLDSTNAVVHVIDTVLLPAGLPPAPPPAPPPAAPVASQAGPIVGGIFGAFAIIAIGVAAFMHWQRRSCVRALTRRKGDVVTTTNPAAVA